MKSPPIVKALWRAGCWSLLLAAGPVHEATAQPAQLDETCFVGALLGSLSTTAGVAAEDPCQVRHEPSISGVALSLEAVKPTVTLGEPIIVVLSIRSSLQESIRVDLGKNHQQGLVFTVQDPLGRVSEQRIPWPPEGGIYVPGEETLQAGQEYRQELLLNEWYQPKEPGTYSFCGRIEPPVADESGREIGTLAPAPLVIEVLPRDQAVLRAVCEDLEGPARSANAEVASRAARALAHVNDPVAVPFLKRVLVARGHGAYYAIEGLGRIGGRAAIEALIDSFPDLGGFERLQVRSTVARLRASITDESLRRRVDELLAEKLDVWSGELEDPSR